VICGWEKDGSEMGGSWEEEPGLSLLTFVRAGKSMIDDSQDRSSWKPATIPGFLPIRGLRRSAPKANFPAIMDAAVAQRPFAIILPACEEEECLGAVLDELRRVAGEQEYIICVGVNGSADRTAEVARQHGALVAETPARGYGFGCQAAIDLIEASGLKPQAYLFMAADGANDPADLAQLVAIHRGGVDFVLGCRTDRLDNVRVMSFQHTLANRLLGLWCGVLTGRFFKDIGPLRLIERNLYWRLALREWTYGWTIEAQVAAARLGVPMRETPVAERCRLAGRQKVSKVNWRRSLRIGLLIAAAGWRTRWRRDQSCVAEKSVSGGRIQQSIRRAEPGTKGEPL
jgi:hypothetical protein